MESTTDHVKPGDKWRFDEAVTACFDDMLERSIPLYPNMRDSVHQLAMKFARKNTWILDLGCSRGQQLHRLCHELGANNSYCGVEISEPMADAAKHVLKAWIEAGLCEIRSEDLRSTMPDLPSSVILAVLTLQFIPIEHRQKVTRAAYETLLPGGAMIVVEKVLGSANEIDEVMVDRYYALKHQNGYSEEDITRKRLSLEGVLVPLTADWNEDMLRKSGFRQIDCFWRWMNFAGWIALK